MAQKVRSERRAPLRRDSVLGAAVALADREGIESLSMRRLAEELGVVPMALYKHVASKEELLDGMVDVVIGEVDPPIAGADWKSAVRARILSARSALLRHSWAASVIESRTNSTMVVLHYMDSMIGIFRGGGFSIDLTHHVMHTMGSRMLGFTQELFNDSQTIDPQMRAMMVEELGDQLPHIAELVTATNHDGKSIVGEGCDDQAEFEFALDLMLDGIERARALDQADARARSSPSSRRSKPNSYSRS